MRERIENSRLKSHLKQQAYRNVFLAVFGVIAIIALIIIFGSNILIGFSLLVGKFTGTDEPVTTTQNATYLAPPTLNPIEEATSKASIAVSGYGEENQRIDLYRNGKVVSKTFVKSDNSFRFSNVPLVDGENRIKAKAVSNDDKKSNYSNELKVTLLNKAPELTVDTPQDGQGFKKEQSPVKVTGKTDPGVKVTVNDFWAIVDSQGNYTYLYPLKDGDNNLKVTATDTAGNQTTKELKIRIE